MKTKDVLRLPKALMTPKARQIARISNADTNDNAIFYIGSESRDTIKDIFDTCHAHPVLWATLTRPGENGRYGVRIECPRGDIDKGKRFIRAITAMYPDVYTEASE